MQKLFALREICTAGCACPHQENELAAERRAAASRAQRLADEVAETRRGSARADERS